MGRLNGTDRPYDLVLFGATGFVGALTAEYLAAHAPKDLRWAVVSRDSGWSGCASGCAEPRRSACCGPT